MLPGESKYEERKSVVAAAEEANKGFDGPAGLNQSVDSEDSSFLREPSRTIYAKAKDNDVTLASFHFIKVIGRGSFGKVFLVKKKDSGQYFAMKSLRKDVIIDYDQVESTKLEKDILLMADHPFLVGMHYVF